MSHSRPVNLEYALIHALMQQSLINRQADIQKAAHDALVQAKLDQHAVKTNFATLFAQPVKEKRPQASVGAHHGKFKAPGR